MYGRTRGLGKYAAVSASVIASSYVAAMYLDYEKNKKRPVHLQLIERGRMMVFSSQDRTVITHQDPSLFSSIKQLWNSRKESEKTVLSIICANSAVFLAWRMPSCQRFLSKYFLHAITSHPITMVGSVFSHQSFTHLLFNMMALYSFGTFLHERMGREQFCAFYLSAGVASSFGSHLYKSLRYDFTPSLGASGAIFGIFGACAHYPALKVSLIFLPFHSVPISQALPVLMGVDIIGLLRNWKMFDHAAHLTGSSFGYLLYPVSNDKIWKNRRKILTQLRLIN